MNEDIALLEVMLELCEEDNEDLKDENAYYQALIRYLEYQNKQLVLKNNELHNEFINLIKIEKRLN